MSNVGTLDRIVRAIAGLALIIAPFAAAWPIIVLVVSLVAGGVVLATAAVGFCPIYAALGLSSKLGRLGRA